MAQMVKCLPAMWETWVLSLGQEDLHNVITIKGFENYRLKYIFIYINTFGYFLLILNLD